MDTATCEDAIRTLYQKVIKGWNDHNAADMSAPFAADGELIGFDGSQMIGRKTIFTHLHDIFSHHRTPPFVYKIKSVCLLGEEVGMVRAMVGMIPPGKNELEPTLHAHQTLVAKKQDEQWEVVLFQNTPAQFHGRPELVEQFTEELRPYVQQQLP